MKTKGVWMGCLAVVGLVSAGAVAQAKNVLESPTKVTAILSMGQVLSSSSRVYGDRRSVFADVTMKYRCQSGFKVTDVHLHTPFDGQKSQKPKTPGRTEGGVVFKNVKLMTAEGAERICGRNGFGMHDVTIKATVDCYKHSIMNTLKKFRSHSNDVKITVGVQCRRQLVPATSRAVQWRHSCSSGYWLEGKEGKRTGVTNRPNATCVKKGTSYSKG